MRLKWLLSLTCIVCLCGCAKFPPAGSNVGATRLSFRFTLNGPVNPSYIYIVAIRVLNPAYGTDTTLSDPSQGPTPIVDTGSKNGIVGGLPTHYVVFVPTNLSGLYSVYRFPSREEEGTSADPSDPTAIDLRYPGQYVGDVLPGSAINPMNTDGTFGSQLGFDIDTSYLDQHATNAQSIQVLQFNILTMNLPATSSSNVNQRVMDAIGNQSSVGQSTFTNPIQVNVTTGGTYTDQTSSVPEQANDTFPGGANLPAVDLTSWSLTVSTP